MKINLKKFLQESGITESVYPGKRLVHTCRQAGEYKSHCVVLDWRNPDHVRIEVKAGLSGRDLEPAQLKYYPVSFQAPTYVDIDMSEHALVSDDHDEEDEKGKASGGGKSPHISKIGVKDSLSLASQAFGDAHLGKIPEVGKILEIVIMGTKIAQQAYANVMSKFAQQITHAKIAATDLLAQAGDYVTRYTPPSFMRPTGDEQKVYRYDREKNADIGFKPGSMGL
jgi:hypothetical protein